MSDTCDPSSVLGRIARARVNGGYTSKGHKCHWPIPDSTDLARMKVNRAAIPSLKVIRPRECGERLRYYQGVRLK
jgi:hypothetical protein